MKNQFITFSSLILLLAFSSCNEPISMEKQTSPEAPSLRDQLPVISHVMTLEDQEKLTPEMVLDEFKEGNARFTSGEITLRDHSEQIRKAASAQFPKAVVLSCLDSRVPVEDVFDQGIGDIFVGRVAGNFINEDQLGSMEFACKVAGAKLIMVMGHESCGAVKAAIDDVKLGNITAMLTKINPAVQKSQDFDGEKTSKNDKFIKHVCVNNVNHAISQIRERSPILKKMEENGEIKIVGVYYNLSDGSLEFVN